MLQSALVEPRSSLTYSLRARPLGGEAAFTLRDTLLNVAQGRRSGDIPLADILEIRLLYRPRNTTHEGYQAKLGLRGRGGVSFGNLSWRNLFDMERQDADYRRFVMALVGAVAAANPGVALLAGMPAWLHRVAALAGLASMLAVALTIVQALRAGSFPMALLAGGFGLYFGWWTWRYLARNRPRSFTADAIPDEMLPKG